MVEENVLRLEIRKLRGFLNARADEVLSLESRQVQLQLAIEERAKEVDINRDMLRLQIKNAEEERHSANAELRDRVAKVEKFKRRYEILVTQFAPPEDGLEEERSQAFYVIRAAQQREELQREGDDLDSKIRKSEKEIKALENTLKLLIDRNEEYRMNLYKAELNNKDVQHKEMLDQQYRLMMERYKAKRQEIQDFQHDLLQLERALASLSNEEAERVRSVQIFETKVKTMGREIKDQRSKSERAEQQWKRQIKEWRKKHPSSTTPAGSMTSEELDIFVRQAKELGSILISELMKGADSNPGIALFVQQLFQQVGIQPPSKPVSQLSSRANSVHGDRAEFGARASSSYSGSDPHSRNSSSSSRGLGALRSLQGSGTELLARKIDLSDIAGIPLGSPSHGGFSAERNRSLGALHASSSKSERKSVTPPLGPITGSARLKRLASQGSDISNISRDSAPPQ
ncbi:hypothetical protein BJ742DRAFT_174764 [Cladochytrium replicatum]|nr:hypothetical protein BJ742DRAFT_174764 [Cladochytrium replicatum]